MEFNYSYRANSAIADRGGETQMSFSPDTTREPTFFSGELRKGIAFREAISALHDVVVSDLRFKPKDRKAYKEWLAQQELVDWSQVASKKKKVATEIKSLTETLREVRAQYNAKVGPFESAKRRYFDYLYKRDYNAWFVLDPVITVHPDEIFFECFSQDESSYGRLGSSYEVFKNINEFECGTTNIDYSAQLYNEFQKIRSYKTTRFEVDPSGFNVQTAGEEDYKEVKIDLPDTWVRGFLQVNSAMSLPATRFDLHPMDLHNFCFVLRRHREKRGPRSMRFVLKPGEPIRVLFDPWGTEVLCARSIYKGKEEKEVRVWGRRRIHILERLIPVAKKFTVHLLGQGLPSFYVADLGDLSFTLGLSGWTANDWATAGNFDLMAPRADVDDHTKQQVFSTLKKTWRESPDDLAKKCGLDRATVLGAMSAYTQAGRAIFDLNKNVYRARELSRDPLPMSQLRFSNEREKSANLFVDQKRVKIKKQHIGPGGDLTLEGAVDSSNTALIIDNDQRMIKATCNCFFYKKNKLLKGPCEHMLALRIQHSRGPRKKNKKKK
ncbi:MAG: SWIM zinc finger family protein [Planctomycetota bacterium]|nr:SWIM zinc finger family protein [Planctomycetota bacterium]